MGRYVVIDLEMCKVPRSMRRQYSKKMEIIQIGAVLLDETFQIVDQFDAYVYPEFGCLDTYIHQLTGISSENLKEAPLLSEVITRFMSWLPEKDIQMVSWSETDKYQLKNELAEKKIELEEMEKLFETWIDCQKLFGEKLEAERCYSLKDALRIVKMSIKNVRRYSSIYDSKYIKMLF